MRVTVTFFKKNATVATLGGNGNYRMPLFIGKYLRIRYQIFLRRYALSL